MKKILVILLLVITYSLGSTVFAETKNIRIVVKGLACSMCSQKLETEFKKLPEVQTAVAKFAVKNPTTNKEENVVNLTFVEGKTLTREQIETIIKDLTYTVVSVEGL